MSRYSSEPGLKYLRAGFLPTGKAAIQWGGEYETEQAAQSMADIYHAKHPRYFFEVWSYKDKKFRVVCVKHPSDPDTQQTFPNPIVRTPKGPRPMSADQFLDSIFGAKE